MTRDAAPLLEIRAGGPEVTDRHLGFRGSGATLFGIHIVNVFLTLLTLGVYYFWGKVRVRNYLFSQTEFAGDRFGYHGIGRELFIGFLKALLLFGIPVAALNLAPAFLSGPWVQTIAVILIYVLGLIFVPVAMVGTRRYRLSRTSWRGIRFSFRGRLVEFVRLFVAGTLLTMVTLGLYYPIFAARRYGFLTAHSYFGTQKADFDGAGRPLFWSYVLALLLTLPTLGLCWFWFIAKKRRYFWNHTYFGPVRFYSTVSGGALFLLKLTNLGLLVLTLGLAWPWVVVRTVRFEFRYLTLRGRLDLAAIQQQAQAATATGEGLAGFLDTGFDFGAG